MIVDWSKPIIAVPTREDIYPVPVTIDATYHRDPGYVPVKFPTNLWATGGPGGTWYFTDDGRSVGGKLPDGDDSRFVIINELMEDGK